MFGGLQLKLIAIGLLAAAIAAGAWRYHHVKTGRDEARAEAAQAKANYAALQGAVAHERKISKDATDDYEARLAALSAAATATPTRSVRLCSSPTGWVPATAATASRTGSADPAGREDGTGQGDQAGPDIGNELYALADTWDRRAAQCNSLIRWVESR